MPESRPVAGQLSALPVEPCPPAEWLPLQTLPTAEPDEGSRLRLDPGSAWLDGHFPGQPLLPGVALLAAVWETARRGLQARGEPDALCGFKSVRFKQFVLPGAEVEIRVAPGDASPTGSTTLRFTVTQAGELVCSGSVLAGKLPEP